ncbi:three-helix bundle dimerization domain-containing protein [Kribbella sp. NPDC050124]|uniref:three-helix bundle dimerization domain-containing protein n=1 Tax=Kribbella sp. NPDC050124 TaxID=3364114 RepID=UPI00378BC4DC
MDRSDEERAIGEVVDRLAKQFPRVPAEDVALAVSQSRPEFDAVPIRDFVPLFVERGAKARLRELAAS